MPRELSQLETYLVHEFIEDYVDGIMSRRDMMRRVLRITGGVAATATVLTQLGVKPASAQEGTAAPPPTPTGPRSTESVAEDDPRISDSVAALHIPANRRHREWLRPAGWDRARCADHRRDPRRPRHRHKSDT
jgi:hypothetical protein